LAQLSRQPADDPLERCHDFFGMFAAHLHQHHVARGSFHQRADVAICSACEQIAFPVSWYGAILCRGGPFADRHRVSDLSPATLASYLLGLAHASLIAQMRQ